jgi:hypothetical protein
MSEESKPNSLPQPAQQGSNTSHPAPLRPVPLEHQERTGQPGETREVRPPIVRKDKRAR